jgi:hypothetical protein
MVPARSGLGPGLVLRPRFRRAVGSSGRLRTPWFGHSWLRFFRPLHSRIFRCRFGFPSLSGEPLSEKTSRWSTSASRTRLSISGHNPKRESRFRSVDKSNCRGHRCSCACRISRRGLWKRRWIRATTVVRCRGVLGCLRLGRRTGRSNVIHHPVPQLSRRIWPKFGRAG